jgi:predicted DNA-binding protein with PD1-like motif
MIEARSGEDLILRMTDGEDLVGGLLGLLVNGAVITSGIGMIREARLGYWNGHEYEEHAVSEPVELLSMQGNIAVHDGKPIVHCHVSVARRDGAVMGGHLLAATVANTAEVALRLLVAITLERRTEPTGLAGLYPRV